MHTSNEAKYEAEPKVTRRRPPWLRLLSWMLATIVSGLVSGVLLGAVGYYHDVRDDDGAALVFTAVTILAFLVAGFLAARGAGRALAGMLTGLVSGILGAVCGLFILQQAGDANAASLTIPRPHRLAGRGAHPWPHRRLRRLDQRRAPRDRRRVRR